MASLTQTSTPPTVLDSSLTELKSAIMKWSISRPVSLLTVSTAQPIPASDIAELIMTFCWAGYSFLVFWSTHLGMSTSRSRGKLMTLTRLLSAEMSIIIMTSEWP
jgi:hypothetical protein